VGRNRARKKPAFRALDVDLYEVEPAEFCSSAKRSSVVERTTSPACLLVAERRALWGLLGAPNQRGLSDRIAKGEAIRVQGGCVDEHDVPRQEVFRRRHRLDCIDVPAPADLARLSEAEYPMLAPGSATTPPAFTARRRQRVSHHS
jgi:hypothetical protein